MATPCASTGSHCHCPRPLRILCLLVLLLPRLPLSRAASAVTHLPGFHGRLPFHLETGYVEVEEETGTELFYYFAESERSPGTDPVVLWMEGGPRCSALSGLVYEVGPLNFILKPYDNGSLPQLVYNPYTWSKIASIIFLDSPVGAGFSYARDPKGYDVGDTSSSKQVVTFLHKWFTDHPSYISNPFYIGGSSYAGKVVPIMAHYIDQGNEQGKQPKINLKGYIIGNPITGSRFIDFNSKVPFVHGMGLISDQLYEAAIENCKGDYVNPTNRMCDEVLNTIESLISEVDEGYILDDHCVLAAAKPVNLDIVRDRFLSDEAGIRIVPNPPPTINCYSYRYYLSNIWANDRSVRDALNTREGTIGEWVRAIKGFPYAQDVPSSIEYQVNLTTSGYRALVISGDHDAVVPFLGTQAWIRSLNFSIIDHWRAWHVNGQTAGFTIAYANHMTFATLKNAGHSSVEYRPKQAFAMAQRWLNNKPL